MTSESQGADAIGANLRPAVLVVPGIGGRLWAMRDLIASLEPHCKVILLQPQGSNGNSRPTNCMPARVAECWEEIAKVSEPISGVIGYCLGGFVAYELAQKLASEASQAVVVALIDTVPPFDTAGDSTRKNVPHSQRFLFKMRRFSTQVRISGMQAVAASIGSHARMARHIMRKLLCDLIALFRVRIPFGWREHYISYADHFLLRAYRPGRSALSVELFLSREEPDWKWRAAQAVLFDRERAVTNWKYLAAGGVHLCEVGGDHETMLRQPHVEVIAKRILKCIGVPTPR